MKLISFLAHIICVFLLYTIADRFAVAKVSFINKAAKMSSKYAKEAIGKMSSGGGGAGKVDGLGFAEQQAIKQAYKQVKGKSSTTLQDTLNKA